MGFDLSVSQLAAQTPAPPAIKGRYVAAIADADMRAYAYIDGQLGKPRGKDRLSLISLPIGNSKQPTSQIEVSNSVVNPVFSIEAAPNGKTVFVAETLQPREPKDVTLPDLNPGTKVRAIDVSNLRAPKVIDTVEVGQSPCTVDVHPKGDLVVVATKDPTKTLTFIPFRGGRFGKPNTFPLKGFAASDSFLNKGNRTEYVEWHP